MTNAGGMDDAGRGLGTCFSTDATHRWVRGCHAYCIKRAWVGVTDTCKRETTGVGSWSPDLSSSFTRGGMSTTNLSVKEL